MGIKRTVFAYVLSFVVMAPGLLLVAARQQPHAVTAFALLTAIFLFVFRQQFLRLWNDYSSRRSLLIMAVGVLAIAAVLEALRQTEGPFMAFVFVVVLPSSVALVLSAARLQKLAWSESDN